MIQLEVDQGGNAVVVLGKPPATSAEAVRGRSASRQSGDRLLHAQTRSMRQNVYWL